LTSTVRVRFGASDGPSFGNIIEAGVDNVEVWAFGGQEPTCDDGIQNQGEDRIDCGGPCPPCNCLADEDCIDGLFCNGTETCDPQGECQTGSDPCPGQFCNEDNDICEDCSFDSDCDDGLYCNGTEICVNGTCQSGAPVNCDDGIDCTDDSCNETTDSCENVPNNALCDNGLYCDGVETCVADSGCQNGVSVNCDDTIDCTTDSCNEATDSCDHLPDNGFCSDGVFCNGTEVCDPLNGCQAGGDACPNQLCDEGNDMCIDCFVDSDCDDGLFCNGLESCAGNACQAGSAPCEPGQVCNEETDMCENAECLSDSDCDDGNECTVDTCVAGVCYNECPNAVSPVAYAEGFEGGFGAWSNVSGDDMDWTRRSGSTPSSITGPSGAHGGTYYVYIEASSPNYPNKTSLLESPCFDLKDTVDAQLTFWYHMYGAAMGTLSVEVSQDCTNWITVWSLSGNQGDTWHEANVDLTPYSNTLTKIRFRGTTGSSYRSDMAIDDLSITATPMSPCDDDADCDDGLFCNGAEICVDHLCRSGGDPCPGQGCDEGNNQCIAGPVFEDDFEGGNMHGWNLYGPDSTAGTGDWVIGDPNGTVSGSDQAQPESAFEGTGCAFTAQNSALGTDDVDTGVTYLVSPVIDLSMASSAELTFVRWFYNRDVGEDTDDFFVVEISEDDGASWINLERIETDQSVNSWTERSFTLESFINLTSTVRVRFGASDGPSFGNIIEAGVDNVEVWAFGSAGADM
jgi:hypothetical protein